MSSSNLANLIFPQSGKMRQISSQGRQVPPEPMAKAIGIGEPGKSVQIEPGETYTVAEIEGAGTIVRIWMTTMWPMPGLPHNFNHYLVLRFTWDGEESPSVEVPFGDFFGVPWGEYTHYVSEPLSCTSGGYNCQFQMPFSNGCRIEVVNQGPAPCMAFFFQVQYLELDEQPAPLRFHAQWRRENPTRHRVPYRVLEAEGAGHFAGMHLWMQKSGWWLDPAKIVGRIRDTGSPISGLFPEAAGMGMLEGWESIYVDGEESPSIPSTRPCATRSFNSREAAARCFRARSSSRLLTLAIALCVLHIDRKNTTTGTHIITAHTVMFCQSSMFSKGSKTTLRLMPPMKASEMPRPQWAMGASTPESNTSMFRCWRFSRARCLLPANET